MRASDSEAAQDRPRDSPQELGDCLNCHDKVRKAWTERA